MLALLAPTDPGWAPRAVEDLDRVLCDHAHCEMKAAVHAMSLATRHPQDHALVRRLVALAQEELRHFDAVVALLAERGIPLGPPPVDEYAAALRQRAAKLPRTTLARGDLVDRLLVACLIEARSCERFKLLAAALGESHPLHAFYEELFAAEARHHRELVVLATDAAGDDAGVDARLRLIAALEADIVRAATEPRPTIHG